MDSLFALTAGEKIKTIRDILGISQEQLAGENMTRNFISMVESGKTRLTWRTAEDIANNANNFARTKHLKFKVSAKYLMENEQAQIEKMADEYIDEIIKETNKGKLIEKFSESEIFFKCNNININYEKFYKLYDVMIDKYYKHFYMEDYIEECKFLIIKALEITNKKGWHDKSLSLYCKLSKMYVYSKSYKEAILLNNHIENMELRGLDDLILIIKYNSAYAYYKLKNYAKCIEILKCEVKKYELTNNQSIDVEILEAICVFYLKEYDTAERKYLKILSQALVQKNNIAVARLYLCLAVLYNNINDVEGAYKYIQLSMELINIGYTDDSLNLEAYEEYFKIVMKYSKSNCEIFDAFRITLDLYININNVEVEEKVVDIAFKYCMENENKELMISILEYIYNMIMNGELKNSKNLYIYFFKAYEYFEKHKEEYKNKVLKMGIDIIKKLD